MCAGQGGPMAEPQQAGTRQPDPPQQPERQAAAVAGCAGSGAGRHRFPVPGVQRPPSALQGGIAPGVQVWHIGCLGRITCKYHAQDSSQPFLLLQKPSPNPGTAILLIHGFGGGSFAWRHVMQPLAARTGLRVLAFDRPAFGEPTAGVPTPPRDFSGPVACVCA